MDGTGRRLLKAYLICCLLLPLSCYGQYHYETHPVTEDVIHIEQTSYNPSNRKDGWKTYYNYADGNLLSKQNYYKKELRGNDLYEYTSKENYTVVKHKYNDGQSLTKKLYNSQGQLIKEELYQGNDTLNPTLIHHSFQYNDQHLKSYKYTSYSSRTDFQKTVCIEINHRPNKGYKINYLDSCKTLNRTVIIVNDKKGNPYREIINHHDPTTIIMGGRSHLGIQNYYYEFDKRGNWVKRFYVTPRGKKVLEIKRKITYKT